MTNKGKVLTVVIIAAVVFAGAAGFYFKGGDLMGKMFGSTCPSLKLSADSPSGSYPVSLKGKVAVFNLSTSSSAIDVTDLKIRCKTSMDPFDGAKVYVDFDGANGESVNAPSCDEGLSWPIGPVHISANSSSKINLYYESATLPINAGQDDPFVFSMENVKWTFSDTGRSKSLSDCVRSPVVNGNTLKY